jgi:hypothetical protein
VGNGRNGAVGRVGAGGIGISEGSRGKGLEGEWIGFVFWGVYL